MEKDKFNKTNTRKELQFKTETTLNTLLEQHTPPDFIEDKEKKEKAPLIEENFEMRCGVVIAIFAALMSIGDLFSGQYGADEIILTNEKSQAYMWYQSKSIKENLLESEFALLQNLIQAGVVKSDSIPHLQDRAKQIQKKIQQYEKEKNEILLGSEKVGQQNWAQDKDGILGQIKGALEFENELQALAKAGDRFDFGSLLFQMCLVFGALALVLKRPSLQKTFFQAMIAFGIMASGFSMWGYFTI